MREVKMPSGAILKIGIAPFAEAKALYQAVLEEAKNIRFSSDVQLSALYKDIFCFGFSSPRIEKCLWECFKKCTYNPGNGDLKIDGDTFEPESARGDYMSVCMEVAKENVGPFVKNLYAEYLSALKMMPDTQASRSQTTT